MHNVPAITILPVMMLASRLRPAKRASIRSAAFFTDRCNLRSSLHSYYQAYRHQAQRQNSWFGRGTALRWNCACQIPTPWAFSVFSRTFIGRPSFSVPNWQYQVTGAHGLFTMQSRMMHVPRSKIRFAQTKNAENRYLMGTELQIRSFLTKMPFASNLHHR